jgi:hypothetical protein
MRSYIFTEYERRVIRAFLSGKKVDRLDIGRIKHRARKFRDVLETDFALFKELAETL